MSSESHSTKRILSRSRLDEHTKSESVAPQKISTLSSPVSFSSKQKEAKVEEIASPANSQMHAATLSSQQTQMVNYINKEPFNEDIEVEECSLYGPDMKWRALVFDKFRGIIDDLKRLQTTPAENKLAIKDLYKKGLLLCGVIKKLNRVSNMKVNKGRIRTHEEKIKIDEHHLELQNLLYEISHLKNEINKCLEFSSLHEKITLVSKDEFFAKAPVEISKPEITKYNEHTLKLAQLDWELIQRQSMTEKIKDLESQISHHETQVKFRQNKLESLHPKLNQILEACKPTLEYFDTNFEDNCMFSETVQCLPRPLFQFYMMISAYKDTLDKHLQVEILGDLDDAKRYNLNEKIVLDDDDSDSDNDENDNEHYKKKKSSSKTNKKKMNHREKVFCRFPLSCKVTFNLKEYGQFSLEFFYYNILNIVTVKSETSLPKDSNENSILNSENVFNCLYENDNGQESPNIANKLLMNNLGIESIVGHLKTIGHLPYKWSQVLCGLYFTNRADRQEMILSSGSHAYQNGDSSERGSKEEEVNNGEEMEVESDKLKQSNGHGNANENREEDEESQEQGTDSLDNKQNETKIFEQIVNRLKYRFRARVALQNTLQSLKSLRVPTNNSYSIDQFRFKVQSVISSFRELSYEKFCTVSYAGHLLECSGLSINETDCSFYELNLSNSRAHLQAQIVLNGQYPKVTPLFALNIHWKHDRNSSNDEAVRDIEREINLFRDSIQDDLANVVSGGKYLRKSLSLVQKSGADDKNFDLFAKQINHLLICFDVYLESESYFLNNFEYQRLKLFPNSVRGRDRKRPFSYLASKDLFVQRMQYDSNDLDVVDK